MSRNLKFTTAIFALVLGTVLAGAQAAPAAKAQSTPAKVGIINIQLAIANTNEGKKEIDALQQRFAPKQVEIKNLNDEVENLKKQLQAQGDKLSDDARATQVRTLENKQKQLQRTYDDAQGEFQQAEQEIMGRLGPKMGKVLQEYAQKNGYAVILDVSNPQTPVLYASENTNVTKEVVDAYNAQAPVAAAKPAGAAARPKPAGAASTAAKTGATGTTKHP